MAKKTAKATEPKLIKVKCLIDFYDLKADLIRHAGSENGVWEVTKERLAEIQKVEETAKVKIIEVL